MSEQAGDAAAAEGGARTRRRKSAAGAFPASRIKRIIQMDRDIGKVSSETPAIFGLCHPFPTTTSCSALSLSHTPTSTAKAVELFLQDLATKSLAIAESHGTHTLSPAHVFAAHMTPQPHHTSPHTTLQTRVHRVARAL